MLISNADLERIRAGKLGELLRTWKRPTVKAGGTLRTRLGVVRILAVEALGEQRYRIRVAWGGEDPRVALRQQPLTEEVRRKLARWPWALDYLRLIRDHPGVLAETLAHRLGEEKKPFKARVRRLKELGLTESLRVGYRLSPRGEEALA